MSKKIRMMCLIQESSISSQEIRLLESNAKRLYQKHFGQDYKIMTVWAVIPMGQAFLAAQPSTASTVSIPVENGLDNERRHAFMAEFCQMWMDIVHCNKNEIILSVMDQDLFAEWSGKSMSRINPKTRKFHLLRMAFKLVKSKIINGYFSMNINFSK